MGLTIHQKIVLEAMQEMAPQQQGAVVQFANTQLNRPSNQKEKVQKRRKRVAAPSNSTPKQRGRQVPAQVPRGAGATRSEHPKPNRRILAVATAEARGIRGSAKEDRCEICHRIMPSGYLADHQKLNCPGRPGVKIGGGVGLLPFRLLPPGAWELDHIKEYYSNEARHWLGERTLDDERLRKVARLNPSCCSVGTEGQRGYILYEFAWTSAVLLECPVVGNATYILGGDWHGMLRLTKSELRLKPNCRWIVHTHASFGRMRAALECQKPGRAFKPLLPVGGSFRP